MSKFSKIVQSKTPTLVDFYADWCGPCKMMKPVLHELKQKLGDDIKILKVDVDKNAGASNKYKIRGVPTFILFQEGEIKWRKAGAMTINQLEQVIQENTSS